MKYCFLILLCFTLSEKLFAQPVPPPSNLLPVLTPSSPEVASFAKYGNYSPNLFNGTISISIPIYEIVVGELRVPITINYHTSGIKVSDIPSYIGSGWSLNVGGMITRQIQGLPDEYFHNPTLNSGFGGYLNGNTVKIVNGPFGNTNDELEFLRNVADRNTIDTEPDIFAYNLPGRSGKFVFNQRDNLKPVFIPYEPLTLSRTHPNSNLMLFSMRDESGIQYNFSDYEKTSNSSMKGVTEAVSSWLLSSMVSSNAQETINFNYTNLPQIQQFYLNDNVTVTDQIYTNPSLQEVSYYQANSGETSGVAYRVNVMNQKNLESITFKNGKVVFELASESREDFAMTNLKKRLKSIKVYNLIGTTYSLIKSIEFHHSYFVRNTTHSYYDGNDDGIFGLNEVYNPNKSKRLKLERVEITGTTNNPQVYSFEYNSQTDNYAMPGARARAIDYWGYYNGKFSDYLVPRTQISFRPKATDNPQTVTIGASAFGTREPDPAFMQSGMLNKIVYPTGGYTKFYYETNKYSPTNSPTDVKYSGGLRIQKIENYSSGSMTPEVKTYRYGLNESGFGEINFDLRSYYFMASQQRRYFVPGMPGSLPYIVAQTKSVRTYIANPSFSLETFDGSPVCYKQVAEYTGDPDNNNGKIVYDFNHEPDEIHSVAGIGAQFVKSKVYHRGQIRFKTIFKKNSPSSPTPYSMVQKIENQYSAFPDNELVNLAMSVTHSIYAADGVQSSDQPSTSELDPNTSIYLPFTPSASPEYYVTNYNLKTGDNKLIKTIESNYDTKDQSGVVTTTKDYFYDNINHHQVTKIQTVNSKGLTEIDFLKYPHDFAAVGNNYQAMVDRNLINKVIENRHTVDAIQVKLQKNNYSNWGNFNHLPQSIQVQNGTAPIETKAQFNEYDVRGNVLEMQKSNDIKQSYIWDYNFSYPIAEVSNSSQLNTAYTSFEAEGKGNWIYTGTPIADATAPTGKRSYTLGNSITKSGLSATTTYIVSYWKKSGTVAVNGTTPVVGSTINGWTYYEHKIVNPSGGLIAVSGTNGVIDELRLYPETAQMTTYTYDPLIGMTSQTDINNRTTYYEYDGFQRLVLIRDQDKNIIKKICYNYAGQPENCVQYPNDNRSGNYTRNNCGTGATGSVVYVSIPPGMFTSNISVADANLQAANYGQAQANANGTCTTNPTCNSSNCSGNNKRCVNGVCQTGVRVNINSYSSGSQYVCVYYYEWSDGYRSQNYTETNSMPCAF